MARLHALFLLMQPAHSWVSTSQHQRDAAAGSLQRLRESNGAINRVWNSPLEATSTDGLGGGLSFAYDTNLCDELLPSFSEASGLWGLTFVDCESIFAAIRTAFSTWSTNHPSLKFNDVTAECAALGDTTGGPFGRGCSRAEIYLTTGTNTSTQDSAATTLNEFRWEPNFFHPNGLRADPGAYVTTGSIVAFTTGDFSSGEYSRTASGANAICWYIDSTFCGGFHRLKQAYGADNVLLIGKSIIFVIWGLGIACTRPSSPASHALHEHIRAHCRLKRAAECVLSTSRPTLGLARRGFRDDLLICAKDHKDPCPRARQGRQEAAEAVY